MIVNCVNFLIFSLNHKNSQIIITINAIVVKHSKITERDHTRLYSTNSGLTSQNLDHIIFIPIHTAQMTHFNDCLPTHSFKLS